MWQVIEKGVNRSLLLFQGFKIVLSKRFESSKNQCPESIPSTLNRLLENLTCENFAGFLLHEMEECTTQKS